MGRRWGHPITDPIFETYSDQVLKRWTKVFASNNGKQGSNGYNGHLGEMALKSCVPWGWLNLGQNQQDILKIASSSFFFFQHPQHAEVLRPGIESMPQQWLQPMQWQCLILNPLSHTGTPTALEVFDRAVLERSLTRGDKELKSVGPKPPPPSAGWLFD